MFCSQNLRAPFEGPAVQALSLVWVPSREQEGGEVAGAREGPGVIGAQLELATSKCATVHVLGLFKLASSLQQQGEAVEARERIPVAAGCLLAALERVAVELLRLGALPPSLQDCRKALQARDRLGVLRAKVLLPAAQEAAAPQLAVGGGALQRLPVVRAVDDPEVGVLVQRPAPRVHAGRAHVGGGLGHDVEGVVLRHQHRHAVGDPGGGVRWGLLVRLVPYQVGVQGSPSPRAEGGRLLVLRVEPTSYETLLRLQGAPQGFADQRLPDDAVKWRLVHVQEQDHCFVFCSRELYCLMPYADSRLVPVHPSTHACHLQDIL
mmetsp:Transcript_79400/g.233282  ORF Transcript_79400/g.233282 Transcript_79400/m.233282 type:complete len:321 (-) Transcript_79400:223-1185(-)